MFIEYKTSHEYTIIPTCYLPTNKKCPAVQPEQGHLFFNRTM